LLRISQFLLSVSVCAENDSVVTHRLNSLKSLNLTNVYPNNKKNNNNNKVKSKPLELFELAGKNKTETTFAMFRSIVFAI
jgi:hypothetical protein